MWDLSSCWCNLKKNLKSYNENAFPKYSSTFGHKAVMTYSKKKIILISFYFLFSRFLFLNIFVFFVVSIKELVFFCLYLYEMPITTLNMSTTLLLNFYDLFKSCSNSNQKSINISRWFRCFSFKKLRKFSCLIWIYSSKN